MSRVPSSCPSGFQGRYTVVSGDTMFLIAQRFDVSLQALINANPHISNPNLIFPGDVLCVPAMAPVCDLQVLTLRLLTETGQLLPIVDGVVQLNARVNVRARFKRPVSRAFFFLEPTGTETCELSQLIGIDCPSAVTGVAEILWEVPPGTLGRVFVVACINSCCAKSEEVLVVRNT